MNAPTNPKPIVIYHSADFDGLFCREIARKFLPDALLIGWDYGKTKLSFPAEGAVYVLDLNPECFEVLPDINRVGRQLVWIDHHKSAIDKWPEALPGYRIDGVAACRLTWQWFARHQSPLPDRSEFIARQVAEPMAVRLAGEYDIWDKRDPDAELFQHGLRSRELTPEWWDLILAAESEDGVRVLLESGKSIQYAQTRQNESIIKEIGFTLQWEGLTFLACNAARYNSLLFTAGLKPEHDACFGFKWTGAEWSVSLYGAPGKPDVDLAAIAVRYGGGGHKQACGFRATTLPFLPASLT